MTSLKALRILLSLGIGAAALSGFGGGPLAQMSEIDAFQRAVSTQTKQDALAFIDAYGSSHLVADLIELLRPEVAMETCASLRAAPARTRGACEAVAKAVAAAPDAGTQTGAPAAAARTTGPAGPTPTPESAPESPARPAALPVQRTAPLPPPAGATPPGATATPTDGRDETLQRLTLRFDQGPFSIDRVDRTRGEMVVRYGGTLDRYVACGGSIGSVGAAPAANRPDRLDSRMIIRIAGAVGGATRIIVQAVHIVSLLQPTSRGLDVVEVRLDRPARTSDGRYCWSTGEMERLAQLK